MSQKNSLPDDDDDTRMRQIMSAFADIDPDFIPFMGELMGMFRSSPWEPELSRYVFGPKIFHVGHGETKGGKGQDIGWLTADLIQKYSPRIVVERLEMANGERPDLVSPTELWMVMYNAVMDSPMRHPLGSIYCWAVLRSLKAGGFRTDEVLEKHRIDCVDITDEDVFGDKNWTVSHTYQDLAREIREKVRRHSNYKVGGPRPRTKYVVRDDG